MERYWTTLLAAVLTCPLALAAGDRDFSQANACPGHLDESMIARLADAQYEEVTISQAVFVLLVLDLSARRAVLENELMDFEVPPDFDGEEGIVKLQKYRAVSLSNQAQCLRDAYQDGAKVERFEALGLRGFVVSLEGHALAVVLTHTTVN